MKPKTIFCFCCAGLRDASGAVSRDWGFGPRYFCAACAPRVKNLPRVDRGPASEHKEPRPEVAVRPAKKKALGAPTMAEWVRQHATLPLEELVRRLPKAFPDSKPGRDPKLAKGYISCYLRKGVK